MHFIIWHIWKRSFGAIAGQLTDDILSDNSRPHIAMHCLSTTLHMSAPPSDSNDCCLSYIVQRLFPCQIDIQRLLLGIWNPLCIFIRISTTKEPVPPIVVSWKISNNVCPHMWLFPCQTFNDLGWKSGIHFALLSTTRDPILPIISVAVLYFCWGSIHFPSWNIAQPLVMFYGMTTPILLCWLFVVSSSSDYLCNARNSCNKQINRQLLCGTWELFIWFLKFHVAGFLITVPWSLKKPLRVSL